ncbi:MAG TPA: DUF1361 domain-containing protein [Candidatus Saccharimonadales bacterium]|nr:DUF1361 domain-containing protein [Candidatus Saccharimonadales bacterium]
MIKGLGLSSPRQQFLLALVVSTLVSLGLYTYGAFSQTGFDFSYMLGNLFLAWLPLAFALWLLNVLGRKRWSSWEGITASLLWLIFLPNSFYMISDFIHLQEADPMYVLFDVVMLASFVFTGIVLGFGSLYLVHRELDKRLHWRTAAWWVAGVLLICSFAIYIGRDLRWNSWDVLFSPGGLLFDVSDRLITPHEYPELLRTTLSFWALLGSMYFAGWWNGRLLHRLNEPAKR